MIRIVQSFFMTKKYRKNLKILSFVCLSVLFLIPGFTSHAQYENVWAFGNYAGIDFNSGQPLPVKTSIYSVGEANASVCNSSGQLLFYTDGTIVWNRNGNIMPNGDYLLPIEGPGNNTPTGSTSQGALIMPIPGSYSKYYVFSLTSFESRPSGQLYYSIIDMDLNNGLGEVVSSQKGILLDSNLVEQMTAVTGGRCNTWLLVRTRYGNGFKAYSISESGIDQIPRESNVGSLYSAGYVGQMVISPDGKRLVTSNGAVLALLPGGVELFDFDIATGIVSNARVLDKVNGYYGAAFSPDNSKLYASTISSIYQFDLTVSEPGDTKTLIGASAFSHLKLAPNGKIYFQSSGSRNILSAIDFPDLAGSGSQFVSKAITLLPGTTAGPGLPNVVSVVVRDTATPASTFIQAPCWVNRSEGYALHIGTEGWDYQWNTGDFRSTLMVDTPGTYWVNYYMPPCTFHSDTFHVTFPNGVLPDITIKSSCKGSNNGKAWAGTYPGDTIAYHYAWTTYSKDTLSLTDTLQNVPSGNYILHINTVNCDTTLTFFIPEEEHKVSYHADCIICQEQEAIFKNTSDSHFTKFFWDFGDGSKTILRDPVHIYPSAGNYTTTLIGIGEICSDTAFLTIVVDARRAASFLHYPDSICVGETVSLTHEMSDFTISSLTWNFGDGNIAKEESLLLKHAYDRAGIMPVTLHAKFRACPESSFSDTVFVFPSPMIDLGPDHTLCLGGAPVILRNRYSLSNSTCLWNTGDRTESIQVRHPGTYSLTVSTAPLGCSATESVEVRKDCYTDIPNAFTPNGDGQNDYFFPRQLLSENVSSFVMRIYNRWGQLVFETLHSGGRGWDGTYNNQEQPAGAYIYYIEAEYNGRREQYRGNVTLIR